MRGRVRENRGAIPPPRFRITLILFVVRKQNLCTAISWFLTSHPFSWSAYRTISIDFIFWIVRLIRTIWVRTINTRHTGYPTADTAPYLEDTRELTLQISRSKILINRSLWWTFETFKTVKSYHGDHLRPSATTSDQCPSRSKWKKKMFAKIHDFPLKWMHWLDLCPPGAW